MNPKASARITTPGPKKAHENPTATSVRAIWKATTDTTSSTFSRFYCTTGGHGVNYAGSALCGWVAVSTPESSIRSVSGAWRVRARASMVLGSAKSAPAAAPSGDEAGGLRAQFGPGGGPGRGLPEPAVELRQGLLQRLDRLVGGLLAFLRLRNAPGKGAPFAVDYGCRRADFEAGAASPAREKC